MSAHIPTPVFGEPSMTWWQVAKDVSETLSAANKVVGYRAALMAMAGPVSSARDRHEFMSDESREN